MAETRKPKRFKAGGLAKPAKPPSWATLRDAERRPKSREEIMAEVARKHGAAFAKRVFGR